MRRIFFTVLLVGGCATAAPEGYLSPCQTDEDCGSPELICVNVPNQYTGFMTEERLCSMQCTGSHECPELVCSDWVGTDLECVTTAEVGGACSTGAIGDVTVRVCGM